MTRKSIRRAKHIAIVGGAGFIGSWLARALAGSGNAVTIIDIDTPEPDILEKCRYLRCDARSHDDMRGKLSGFDTVYMLVSALSRRCDEDPPNGWRTNVMTTAVVLDELALLQRPPHLVYFSSSMVYSSTTAVCPLSETAPVAGEALYDRTKLASEELVKSFCFAHSSTGVIFRPFSVYGPGRMAAEKGHFLARWRDRIRLGLPLIIDGDGNQSIDLLHVDDLVSTCLLATGLELAPGEVETFNVGSGEDARVRTIAEWIQQVDSGARLEFGPPRPFTIARRWADIGKAAKILGFWPKVSPEAGVKGLFAARPRSNDPAV